MPPPQANLIVIPIKAISCSSQSHNKCSYIDVYPLVSLFSFRMMSSMVSAPALSSDRSSTRRKRKKKIPIQDICVYHHGNNDNLPQTSSVQWRSDAQQQVYSSKLFQAIRQVQRSDSSAPKRNRAVREAADRVLANTARGRSRWSRAMLTNRLRLRFLKKNNIAKQQRKVSMLAAGSGRPPRRSKAGVTRLKWKSMQTVERKARVLGGLVPGCRKQPLPVVLEEVTDYIAALEMQVRAMSALATLLSGAGPSAVGGEVHAHGSGPTPSI